MMVDLECPHSIALTRDTCSICIEGPRTAEIQVTPVGPPLEAKYIGTCPCCHFPIRPGQLIRRYSNDRYYHASPSEAPCTP